MLPVVANAILRICSATCSPTPPNAQSSPLAQFRAALFLLAHCTLNLAPLGPYCTLHDCRHVGVHPPRPCTVYNVRQVLILNCLPPTSVNSALQSPGLVGHPNQGSLRPFSNRKLNSPPPSQLDKKTRNTKRLKTAKVLLNCRMGNLFCCLHNIESPTSNKGGQRTLNIA